MPSGSRVRRAGHGPEEIDVTQGQDNHERLEEIHLFDAGVEDLSQIRGLERLHNLRSLNLHCNLIASLHTNQLASLASLTDLNLSSNHIESMRGLHACPSLVTLNLSTNRLRQIDGLSQAFGLRKLWLPFNKIGTLDGLVQLHSPDHQISFIDVRCNRIALIEDVNALSGCHGLQEIQLDFAGKGGNKVCAHPKYLGVITALVPQLTLLDGSAVEFRPLTPPTRHDHPGSGGSERYAVSPRSEDSSSVPNSPSPLSAVDNLISNLQTQLQQTVMQSTTSAAPVSHTNNVRKDFHGGGRPSAAKGKENPQALLLAPAHCRQFEHSIQGNSLRRHDRAQYNRTSSTRSAMNDDDHASYSSGSGGLVKGKEETDSVSVATVSRSFIPTLVQQQWCEIDQRQQDCEGTKPSFDEADSAVNNAQPEQEELPQSSVVDRISAEKLAYLEAEVAVLKMQLSNVGKQNASVLEERVKVNAEFADAQRSLVTAHKQVSQYISVAEASSAQVTSMQHALKREAEMRKCAEDISQARSTEMPAVLTRCASAEEDVQRSKNMLKTVVEQVAYLQSVNDSARSDNSDLTGKYECTQVELAQAKELIELAQRRENESKLACAQVQEQLEAQDKQAQQDRLTVDDQMAQQASSIMKLQATLLDAQEDNARLKQRLQADSVQTRSVEQERACIVSVHAEELKRVMMHHAQENDTMREKLSGKYNSQISELESDLSDHRIRLTELEVVSAKRVKAAQDAASIELKEARRRSSDMLTASDEIQDQVRQHEARNSKSQAMLTHLRDIIDDCESRLSQVAAERDDAVSELRNAEQSLENADMQRQQLDELHQQVVAMQGEQRVHDEKVKALSQQNESELTELKDQLASEMDARQSLQLEAETLQMSVSALKTTVQIKEKMVNDALLHVEELKSSVLNKDSRLDELENRISEQLEEMDSKDDAIDRLREGLADQDQKIVESEQAIDDTRDAAATKEQEMAGSVHLCRDALQNKEKELAMIEQEVEQLRSMFAATETELTMQRDAAIEARDDAERMSLQGSIETEKWLVEKEELIASSGMHRTRAAELDGRVRGVEQQRDEAERELKVVLEALERKKVAANANFDQLCAAIDNMKQ